MAMKIRGKADEETGAKAAPDISKKTSALEKTTSVTFRTRLMMKKKAEKIFDDMGISTSAALNMFLAQVVREKGMPFTPTTRNLKTSAKEKNGEEESLMALEELWDEL